MKKRPQKAGRKLTGGCSCGQVRYQLLDKPMRVHCCHCTDCQRHTGSAFVLNVIIETSAIKILRGRLQPVPVRRAFGPHDIYRCPKCQVALWSDYGHRPQIRFVRVGTLDRPSAIRPDIHGWIRQLNQSKVDFFQFAGAQTTKPTRTFGVRLLIVLSMERNADTWAAPFLSAATGQYLLWQRTWNR